MARYKDSVCRLCRREGSKLFLKGDRCYGEGCSFTKRAAQGSIHKSKDGSSMPTRGSGLPATPGQHGQGRQKKMSEYGIQLREKQKCRRTYGVLESQFRKYYDMATNMRGVTGENMLCLLERRLDNVVYRLGIGKSRAMARQLVNHGHILVDGAKVDIASYLVRAGQVITIRETSRDEEYFKTLREEGAAGEECAWLEFDAENLTGKVVAMPKREDVGVEVQEHLIVEFYSR